MHKKTDYLQYQRFFPLSVADISKMITDKNIRSGKKIKSVDDFGKYFHRNLISGSFETNEADMLHEEILRSEFPLWNELSLPKKYKKYNEFIYGRNEIEYNNQKSLKEIILNNMKDKTLALLFFASLMSLFVGGYKVIEEHEKYAWIEGTSILLAVVIIILIGTINEYSQKKLFFKLDKKKQTHNVKIFNNYTLDTKNSTDLIVGDVIYFEPGDLIPADCVIISEDYVICDEQLISGESEPVSKSVEEPFLISGTYITEGVAKAIVISVGKNSVKGKLIQNMKEKNKKTPLEHKIEELAQSLAKKAFFIGVILLICHSIKIIYLKKSYHIREIMSLIVESISIIVMAVPEGLPMAITLALSFGTKRMLRDNNLVRDISACETMNNTNYICTDKTGTLTYNEMSIRYAYVGHHALYIKDSLFEDKTHLFEIIEKHASFDLTVKNMVINSSAFQNSEGFYIGSRSESAILKILKQHQIDYNFLRREHTVIRRYPFSSKHKYMSSMIKKGKKYIIFFKGAPETIAQHCNKEINKNEIVPFNQHSLNKFIKKSDRRCFRSLAFSYLELEMFDEEAVKLGKYPCTFLCAIAMEDPLRENVKEEILQCKNAGINVVMLTGDKMTLAENLAVKLGILTSNNLSLTGHNFRKMSDSELGEIIHNIKVVARASPEDKKRFVEILQKKGNVVAVTGDGSNDGPALKCANVGFGMGVSGTDIAKEASSIILMDDKFSSLVKCIEWGRCINSSVRKFIQFQLTTTVSTVVIAILSSLFTIKGKSAFSPLKLLWINIIMDSFAALALSTDKPTKDLLRRNPEPLNTPILTLSMKWFIFLASCYQFAIIGFLYYIHAHNTFIFNTFIFLQIFNEINARSLDPFESPFAGLLFNKIFLFSNLFVILLQYIVVNHLGIVFKTQPMTVLEWALSIVTAFSIVIFFIFIRIVQRYKIDREIFDWKKNLRYLSMELQLLGAFKDFGNTAYEV
ncbi:plasma membrane calcium [Gurleya vavrai]